MCEPVGIADGSLQWLPWCVCACCSSVSRAGRRARWLVRTWLGGSSGRGRFGDSGASGVSMGTPPVLVLAAMTAREEGVGARSMLTIALITE